MNYTGQPRQLLRPWLTDQIDSGLYPGLEWIDRNQLTFKIPWKHFGRPGVDEHRDGLLFLNYARHTKKYQEGDPADFSVMKTRLRCAMHRHPEIEEVYALNQLDGNDPFKVYRFKPRDPSGTMISISSPSSSVIGSPGLSSSDQNFSSTSSFPALSVHDIQAQLHGDFEQASASHFMGSTNNEHIEFLESLYDDDTVDYGAPSPAYPVQHSTVKANSSSEALPSNSEPVTIPLQVKLFYRDEEVGQESIDNPRGVRVAFNPLPPLPEDVLTGDTSEFVNHVFGPLHAAQIYFPQTSDATTMSILECIKRGLVLQVQNGDIMATRLCRARIYYSDRANGSKEPLELKRECTTKVFDYWKETVPALQQYITGQQGAPSYELFFSFGQTWSSASPLKANFVHICVTHTLAQQYVKELQNQHQSDDILVSEPNMLDFIANQIENLSLNPSGSAVQVNHNAGSNYDGS